MPESLIPSFGVWEIALLAVVPVHATILAYVYDPHRKAFLLLFPFPFTFAALSMGRPVDATNPTGLVVMLMYTHGVRILHRRAGIPIAPAIALSAAGYIAASLALASVVPATKSAFWTAASITTIIGFVLILTTPPRREPGYRSPLPIPFKWLIIQGVILLLLALRPWLKGFMTVFPMMGVVAAYESRHSLRAVCRQIPVLLAAMGPMMMVIRLLQGRIGLGCAILAGWGVLLAVGVPLSLYLVRSAEEMNIPNEEETGR